MLLLYAHTKRMLCAHMITINRKGQVSRVQRVAIGEREDDVPRRKC